MIDQIMTESLPTAIIRKRSTVNSNFSSFLYLSFFLLLSCHLHYHEVHAGGRFPRTTNNRTMEATITLNGGFSATATTTISANDQRKRDMKMVQDADENHKKGQQRQRLGSDKDTNRKEVPQDDNTQKSKRKRTIKNGKEQKCIDSAPRMSRIQRLIRRKESNTAYRMMVLSQLAYWEFHKVPMHIDVAGFRLQNDVAKKHRKFDLIRSMKLAFCRIKRRIVSLKRSFVRLFRQRKKSDNISTNTSPGAIMTTKPRRQQRRKEQSVNSSTAPHANNVTNLTPPPCREEVKNKTEEGQFFKFEYYFQDWHETTKVPRVRWHDTDLLVSSSGDGILALAFAGTQSPADHLTNVQTFEPAAHSGLFHAGKNATIQGNIHRGFLNAYSRVERGSVLRLCQSCTNEESTNSKIMYSMHRRYSNCSMDNQVRPRKERKTRKRSNTTESDKHADKNTQDEQTKNDVVGGKGSGCRAHGEKLMVVLRELVTTALSAGRTVHLTGHSLGGGLTTVLALDIVINFPEVPIKRLHVWTFGAPQVVDEAFLHSAIEVSPRLESFIRDGRNRRFHRFVTLSDDCKEDFIPNIASKVATPKRNLRGRASRRLSGIKGSIVHVASPRYIPPDNTFLTSTTEKDVEAASPSPTTIKSTVEAHFGFNYLRGISRESMDHPLISDLPENVRETIGELQLERG